ncbi:hypothetical protein [Enterovirga rhinocerotis]|uniref:Uncharacterized protein n=1 Tax=Enterovirga rhinocerotis TaxID=1339210 RepID=A0A4R7C5V5_9HYPH|nr:hypothetical protein [Enterovirga rhinocerotis]TDR93601.1 hypothetical protein EV668_0866 [Enterovirga rhinocerotis]
MLARVSVRLRPFGFAAALFVVPAAAVPWLLPTAAHAQATEVVLQNVRLGSGLMVFEAPRVIVRGTRLSQADLTRLLDPASPEPLIDRVMKLEADEILVPELINVVESPQVKQRTVYRDVSFKSIAGGRVASVTSPSSTFEGSQAGEAVKGSMGRMALADLDVGGTVRAFTAKAAPGETLRRLHGAFSIDDVVIDDSKGIKTRVGRMTGSGLSAKPTRVGWLGTMEIFAAAEASKAKPKSDAARAALEATGDLFESFSMGDAEATDISIEARIPDDDMEFEGRIRRFAYAAPKDGRGGEFSAEGLDFGNKDGRVKYDRIAFGGLDMRPAIEAFKEIGTRPDQTPSVATLRNLMTMMSSVRLEGLDVDIPAQEPSPNLRAENAERIRVGLGRFEITAEKPVNGIPTDIKFAIRDLSSPIPPNPTNDGIATVAQLGYDRVDGSFGLSLAWDEAKQEIAIRELTVDGKDMGSASIRAMLGNVVRDVFDPDTAVAQVALMSATAKSVEIAVDNRGLFERFLAMQAKRQKRSVEDIRREYGTTAAIGIPVILGSSPGAKALAQSISKFIAKPGKLRITAKARGDAGFGIADFASNPSPAGVLEAIDITASAE